MTTTDIILELCRHEAVRVRRDVQFGRNCIVWFMQALLWCSVALSLPYLMETVGMEPVRHLPLLVVADQLIRLMGQKTPDAPMRQYALLPVKRWQVMSAYLVRMAFVPANLVWIPAMWGQLWLLGVFVLSGYLYLVLWHAYKRLLLHGANAGTACLAWLHYGNGLVMCEMKMRLRVSALRYKMRNGMVASLMLVAVSLVVRQDAYTDFAVLYTLLFPSLPLLTSRLGYEQAYMGLLSTRMRSFVPLYRAKYLAAVLLLLPSTLLLLLPVSMSLLTAWRLAAWILGTAFVIYPALLCVAPRCRVDSPPAQILSLAAMTLPVMLVNVCMHTTIINSLFQINV